MKIAVAGGTGVVGRYVVEAINGAGHDAVVLSRSRGVDLRADAGVAQALEGVEAIIDAANSAKMNRAKSTAFFTDVTARLQSIGSAQGRGTPGDLSVIGIDRVGQRLLPIQAGARRSGKGRATPGDHRAGHPIP